MDYYFGVDVGGTNIKLGMFSESGRMLETGRSQHAAEIIQRLGRMILCRILQEKFCIFWKRDVFPAPRSGELE